MTSTTTITVTVAKASAAAESPMPVMGNNMTVLDIILTAATVTMAAVAVIITLVAVFGVRLIRNSAQKIARQAARKTTEEVVYALLKRYNLEGIIKDGLLTQPPDEKTKPDKKEEKGA